MISISPTPSLSHAKDSQAIPLVTKPAYRSNHQQNAPRKQTRRGLNRG